jgi:membrane-associated PAP2 superfamily phosphatase
VVALAPDGLTHALKRRGGSTSPGTWPASHASGSFQISALLCLYVNFMAQTGDNGAAAIELLVSGAEISKTACKQRRK